MFYIEWRSNLIISAESDKREPDKFTHKPHERYTLFPFFALLNRREPLTPDSFTGDRGRPGLVKLENRFSVCLGSCLSLSFQKKGGGSG